MGREDGRDRQHARQFNHCRLGRFAQWLELVAQGRVDLDGEPDMAFAKHQTLNHAAVDDISAFWSGNCRQNRANFRFGDAGHP